MEFFPNTRGESEFFPNTGGSSEFSSNTGGLSEYSPIPGVYRNFFQIPGVYRQNLAYRGFISQIPLYLGFIWMSLDKPRNCEFWPINPRYWGPNFFPPWFGPTLMTCGCFGALRLAAARPISLHACSATVQFHHSWAVGRSNISY